MPWALIDVPSLALGILSRLVAETDPESRVTLVHANLDYVDWVTERTSFTPADLHFFAVDSFFSGVGDWVFTSALYGDPQWREQEFAEQLPLAKRDRELTLELHRCAPDFVRELARQIADLEPDVVGFTSTFQQNAAVLAAARMVKQELPGVRTVVGGANCDGVQGAATHRNFSFVDYVVRGEGERTFPQLLHALSAAPDAPDPEALVGIAGLCWRTPDGASVANALATIPLPAREIVSPDYGGFFERLEASSAREFVEPKLVVEGARGCWWGQKHQCAFCGLNGSSIQYRSKSPEAFRDEILALVEQYQVLDLYVVDNILDAGHLRSTLPALAETGYDLRFQYEIKSNLRREQLTTLHDAGVVNVQPGIENLSGRVLRIMSKGVTGCQNVRLLRDAATVGISVSWNYLFGFPGEHADDYLPVVEQFPALHHLDPMEGATRIVLERFSRYFNNPELGFRPMTPDAQYRRNYDLPDEEYEDFAFFFDAPSRGLGESTAEALKAAGNRWQNEHVASRLSHTDLGEEIILVSRRSGYDWTTLILRDPAEVNLFHLLDQPHTVAALSRKLVPATAQDSVGQVLERWLRLGIVFTDGGQFVHVAPEANNQELLRFARVFEGQRRSGEKSPDEASTQAPEPVAVGSASAAEGNRE
jgi:ribosomal peptide maturation radical SAM protein 1